MSFLFSKINEKYMSYNEEETKTYPNSFKSVKPDISEYGIWLT